MSSEYFGLRIKNIAHFLRLKKDYPLTIEKLQQLLKERGIDRYPYAVAEVESFLAHLYLQAEDRIMASRHARNVIEIQYDLSEADLIKPHIESASQILEQTA